MRGNHQFSIGGNWIHSRIETLNNRPTNGAFTFNGQGTGLSLADFMLGIVSGGMIQGNPVFDNDHSEYVGAYAQDNWRVRPNVTVNLGLRWEPFLPVQNTDSFVSHFEQSRFDQNVHSTVYPQAPAGLMFPGDAGYPSSGTSEKKMAQFAPRVGVVWTPNGDERTSVRASWGVFYDTPHLFFNTRFANNPPWGAQITISNPPGGFADPYLGYPGGNPFPALNTGWATQPFPAFGVYVNAPLDLKPTTLQQWNVSVQHQFGDWLASASYLGNHSSHLWRATELNPAVFGPGATTGEHEPAARARAAELRAGTVLRHDRSARRHRPRQLRRDAAVAAAPAEEQPERALELHALEVHERSGDDRDHRPDDRESGEPGSRLLPTARRIAGTSSTCRWSCGRRTSRTTSRARSSATGSCRRSSAGSRATDRRSRPASTTR